MTPEEQVDILSKQLQHMLSKIIRARQAMRLIDSSSPSDMAEGLKLFLDRELTDTEKDLLRKMIDKNT